MKTVTLLEAWSLWMDGQLLGDARLWGMSVLWWGRLGKLTEFIAALTVVADIIGAERLRAYGDSLRGMFTWEQSKMILKSSYEFLGLFLSSEVGSQEKMEKSRLGKIWGIINAVLMLLIFITCVFE